MLLILEMLTYEAHPECKNPEYQRELFEYQFYEI